MKRNRGLPQFPGSRKLHMSLACLILIEGIAIIAQATFLARAITLLFEREPLTEVVFEIIFFLVSYLVRYGVTHIQTTLAENYAEKTGTSIRNRLITSIFNSGAHFIQTEGTGRLVTLTVKGVNDLKKYLDIISIRTLKSVIIPVMIVIYVFTHDMISAVILVAAVPIIIIFMILLGLAAEKMADSQYATYRVLSNHFLDSMKGLETLTYLGESERHGKRIKFVSEQYRKATMKTLRVAFLSSFALDFFTSLSIAFVAVGLGFRLIDGTLLLLPALTILILAPEYFLPIKQVGKDFHATLDGQVAIENIDTIIKKQPVLEPSNQAEMIWTPNHHLQLQTISYHIKDQPVLKDISFSVKGKGLIGIVGPSGSGKSTLLHILTGRIQPSKGRILINGLETQLTSEDWLKTVAYIPQHPYIFPTTLAENIRFYAPEATDQEIEIIVDEIGLGSFVQELPDGIHERVGDGGRTLSGGQEQRIAMARALLSDKSVILLDEPTAHLDIETEYEIKQVMLRLFKDKFVFFATHRLHWMMQMDDLLVMDKGKVVQQGTHEELIHEKGMYALLHHRMSGDDVSG